MIKDRLCNLLEYCNTPEAPLCPLQEITIKNGIWYSDEPICQCELFQNLPWIKKQKLIAELGLKPDAGFFTVRMLNSIRLITKNLRGANPDEAMAEIKWFQMRKLKARKPAKSRTGNAIKNRKKSTTDNLSLLQKQLV